MIVPPEQLVATLRHYGQEHVLSGWHELPHETRTALVRDLGTINFGELESLRTQTTATEAVPANFGPIPSTPAQFTREEIAIGEQALRAGKVAVLLVAGGQGSRLGALQPKGMFPAGAISGASLYQIHAEKVLALSRRYAHAIPLLVMTSPATDAPTRDFFVAHRNFGLAQQQVTFFQQGTMPAVCPHKGTLLLEDRGKLFLSPNGHGGTLTALAESGVLAEIAARGVEHVFYFQVDNPLVKVCDPGFLGRHIATQSEASSKVVTKERPDEKVGVLIVAEGRCSIIEYTLLPKELAEAREPSGALRYRAGNPAIHVFSVAFLERVTRTAAGALPYRVARKSVAHFDPHAGKLRAAPPPSEPNALKFERFIFDALPHAQRWLAVETLRTEEFAPIKNATGVDSPDTARAAQITLHTAWLNRAGIDTRGHAVEISPLFALDANELAQKLSPNTVISGPTVFQETTRGE